MDERAPGGDQFMIAALRRMITRWALRHFQGRLESKIKTSFDPELSHRLDAVRVLLEEE